MVNSVFFLILRRMRAPFIVLIVFYAVAVLGLTIVPGINDDGTPAPPLSFFHAFYFVSYTATTIGFGEIPRPFSDGQRLWVTACIYMTVISWSYTILTVLALLQDKAFLHTLVTSRFARRVRRQRTLFYLVCGCGESGSLICRALDVLGHDFVILDKDLLRIDELELEDFITNDPVAAVDASLSSNLLMAGLCHPKCRGVLAVTDDEKANLAIAINVRLLNPGIPVLARVRSPLVAANMASFGTHHIVNGYERFAQYLALALSSPERFHLIEILTGLPGTPLPALRRPPPGCWIICGYGQFGQAVVRCLALPGIDLSIIDPDGAGPENGRIVQGIGTEASVLEEAGIAHARGIVAGSDNDISNLSIAMMAKKMNPSIFVVARQNQAANDVLFDTFAADFRMVHTRVVAQECVSILTTPLLGHFLGAVRAADENWSKQVAACLEDICGGLIPEVWDTQIEQPSAPALYKVLMQQQAVSVGLLLRDNRDRDVVLPARVLMIVREGKAVLFPDDEFMFITGDALLLAGRHAARSALHLTLQNANALSYVLTGQTRRNGRLRQWLFPRRERDPVSS
jgi:Trk K+ transport system NAD-binding subunit